MNVWSSKKIIMTFMAVGLVMLASIPAYSIPAFARKYGLPCSACHEAWPKLNNFGQVFRDNGYQLMNEKDAPITQQPTYWPMTVRMTPQWHRETTNRVAIDSVAGDSTSPTVEKRITTSGYDLSGLDLWTAGTLYKNISFLVLPSADATGQFHFEAAWVRFNNILGTPWLNFKFGKHELDTPISEKRFLTLTNVGGIYQNYHYTPISDINSFGGIGNNQLGVELMGHSKNSYSRYAVSMLSSNSGQVGLPTGRTYDYYANVNQAFEIPKLGLQRIGAFGYVGKSPTYYLTSGGTPIPGAGRGNRSFNRSGVYGLFYVKKVDFSTLYMHGSDNVFLGTGTPANQALPPGAKGPTWNGAFTEVHYTYNPQLIIVGRYEAVRMSRQAFQLGTVLPSGAPLTKNFGNIDAWVAGYRWYPIMSSRAGLAWHQEYAHVRTNGTAPVTGLNQGSSSFLSGFDIDF